jgi:AraC-like DNA-binding protein
VTGRCFVIADDVAEPVQLDQGDVVILNDRTSVVLSSGPRPGKIVESATTSAVRMHALVSLTPGRDVVIVGGHIDLNATGEALLLESLPGLSHIRGSSAQAVPLQRLLEDLVREMTVSGPGAQFAMHQHAQLLFLSVLRAALSDGPAFPAGWLRLLADERLAPAVRAMHAEPARAWHLDDLARTGAMSRTAFAQRFTAVAGVPPLTYLHQWRMRLAQRALREGDTPIGQLAPALGYSSESAFSNAFKRTVGVAPRRFRDASRASAR